MQQARAESEARGKAAGGGGAPTQQAGGGGAERPAKPLFDALEEADEILARRLQLPARRSQLQSSPALLEEREAEGLGEFPELRRYRRLGEVQLLGGARHALAARDRLEHHQLGEKSVPEIPAQHRAGHGGPLGSRADPPRPQLRRAATAGPESDRGKIT